MPQILEGNVGWQWEDAADVSALCSEAAGARGEPPRSMQGGSGRTWWMPQGRKGAGGRGGCLRVMWIVSLTMLESVPVRSASGGS